MTKVDVKKLELMPVPPGHKIKYQHYYMASDGKRPLVRIDGKWYTLTCDPEHEAVEYNGVAKLFATDAWLEDAQGYAVARGESVCNPKDTPIKKLGRSIAHNRCIKDFHKAKAQQVPHALESSVPDQQLLAAPHAA